jgi:hypothetical protein
MSSIEVSICDGCHAASPDGYNPSFPASYGWIHVAGPGYKDDLDFCSWTCLTQFVASRSEASPPEGNAA